jgi:trehalose-phosphatase
MNEPAVVPVGEFDDPHELAVFAAALPRPLLIGLDVDGVLAPIVPYAGDAELLPGVLDAVSELSHHEAVAAVAVVSGRSVSDLARFTFAETVAVVGTHGLERRGSAAVDLTDDERSRLDELVAMASEAADDAGEGAWVEHKPAGVVLHVREAPAATKAAAVAELHRLAEEVEGVHVKRGHDVVELLARATSKATAVESLRVEADASSVVYVGDDLTDEEVFLALGDEGCSVRVGRGRTAARHRLAGPPQVLTFLHVLADRLD